ncbi:MAG: HAD family phosphatase [Rhizobiales bacterium]|nr:HAD family phosphatase [Hyphomicrobiales bacterium]
MNVVFDLGNVLLRWDPRFLYRRIFAGDEARMEWFLATICTHEWNIEQDKGRSFEDAVRSLAETHPDHAPHIYAYHERWHETLPGAIDETVAILEELDRKGVPLYAITNFNGPKFRETQKRFDFLNRFRDIVVSGEVGILKPDRAIFEHFLARNALSADACLFIDDNLDNVRGAQGAGIEAVHFKTPQRLRRDLVRRGLLS